MVAGVDYLDHKSVVQVDGQGRNVIDYLVTPDIAKELGMLERNARGRATGTGCPASATTGDDWGRLGGVLMGRRADGR